MARPLVSVRYRIDLVSACALWALATVISKHLLASLQPLTLLVLQLLPSAALLWLLVVATRKPWPPHLTLIPLALLGVLNPGLSYTLSMLGLQQASASVATLLWAAEPALIVVLARLILHEVVDVRLMAAVATAAVGAGLVAGFFDAGSLRQGLGAGSALILGGVACCALYTVLATRVSADVDPLVTVAVQQSAGLLWVLSLWPLEIAGGAPGSVLAVEPEQWVVAGLAGLMYYAAAFWFYLRALAVVPASTAGLYLNLTPVFGVGFAYAGLGERLSGAQLVGALIILASVGSLSRVSRS